MANCTHMNNYSKSLKGISPVIAIILMVMITVVLVAFAYSWLQGTMSETTKQTSDVLTQTEKMNQRVNIGTLYVCDSGANSSYICFELRAQTTNKYAIPLNGTGYYVSNVPKELYSWDGGISGTPCSEDLSLAAGGRCFGRIPNSPSCSVGDVFKVSLPWGTETSKGIDGCS